MPYAELLRKAHPIPESITKATSEHSSNGYPSRYQGFNMAFMGNMLT